MLRTTDTDIDQAEAAFWNEYYRQLPNHADPAEHDAAVRAGIEAVFVLALQPESQPHGDHERLAI